MKRIRLFMTISLVLMAVMLSSCFIPDNYEAEVWVHKDGSYEFLFEGELAYAPAIEKILDGEFGDKDIEDMFGIEDDLSGADGFMEAKYINNGKFRVEVIMPLGPGEDYFFLSEDIAIFSFKHDEKGQLVISGLDLTDDDKATLEKLNIKMNGRLSVVADKGVKVKSDNAGMKIKDKKNGTVIYRWTLDANAEKPEMVIK